MRVSNVFSGRPSYYDRGPITKAGQVGQVGIAPHALVNRFTYTVPSGRKFNWAFSNVFQNRNTVATTPSTVEILVQLTPSGGVQVPSIVVLWQGANAVDSFRQAALSGGHVLLAGDNLVGGDLDASIGGTCDFFETFGGIEFDA